MAEPEHNIGLMKERSLHSQVKHWYAKPTDSLEVKVGQYVIDIIRDDHLIEIQTANFGAMHHKLQNLLESNKVRIVYPIPVKKWVVKVDLDGKEISRRKSPKKGKIINIFDELVRIAHIANDENLTFELLMIESEDIWCDDGKGSWRRKRQSLVDRRLIDVYESKILDTKDDFLEFIPSDIERPFTNRSLADASKYNVNYARMITYCLKHMDYIKEVGKEGNALLFDY